MEDILYNIIVQMDSENKAYVSLRAKDRETAERRAFEMFKGLTKEPGYPKVVDR